jgi:hypothetical protein
MTLGLMVITGSAASYPDQDQISDDYSVAVDVLTQLGVFKGKGTSDGANFAPKEILDRGSAAALIYRVITGDVTDAKTVNYQYAVFSDMQDSDWDTGYVTYANNGGYIKGYDGRFSPRDPVTGTQALAIMLRALGYGKNGEFEGEGWEDRVLTLAHQQGLTAGIAYEATLRGGATRELISQLLFNALTQANMVQYNVVTRDYNDLSQTLGDKTFGLVEVKEGVVTGNEYANLVTGEPNKVGEVTIGDNTYVVTEGTTSVATATEVTDLGESRVGWAYGLKGDKTLAYLADSGKNTTWENEGAATYLNVDANGRAINNFKKVTGLTDNAVDYFNFDRPFETDDATARMLITYSTTGNAADRVSISEDHPISITDYSNIRGIFNDTYEQGWVIVGTKVATTNDADAVKQNRDNDISNDIGFSEFWSKYVETGSDVYANVNKADNGEWLKVIDNDGDGKAEYVFLLEFTMAQVTSLNATTGVLQVSTGTTNAAGNLVNDTISDTDVHNYGGDRYTPYTTEDELAKGDVVIVTEIQGVAYVSLAPSFTGTVSSYNLKNDILTVDGEEYGQSGIEEYTGYEYLIANAQKKTEYTFYQDYFDYIRVFAYPDSDASYALLTDGWYNVTKTGKEYAVKAYLNGGVNPFDLNVTQTNNSATFIETAGSANNAWDRLVGFGTYAGPYDSHTSKGYAIANSNVAKYTLADNVLTLDDVKAYSYDKRHNTIGVATDYVDLDVTALSNNQVNYTGTYVPDAVDETASRNAEAAGGSAWFINGQNSGDVTVQATKNTVFYYVYADGKVVTKTGYGEALNVSLTKADGSPNITAVYAVASTATQRNAANGADTYYWVADVIVVELQQTVSYQDVFFNIYSAQKNVADTVYADAILANATEDNLTLNISNNYNDYTQAGGYKVPLSFYQKTAADDNGVVRINRITENYNSYGIYAADVNRVNDLLTYVTDRATGDPLNVGESVPVYVLESTRNDQYGDPIVTAKAKTISDMEPGDQVIAFCNGSSLRNVVYLIDVTKSTGAAQGLAQALFADIVANPAPSTLTYDQAVADALAALNGTAAEKAAALAGLQSLTGLTTAQKANVDALIEKLSGSDDADTDVDTAMAALLDAYDAYRAAKKIADADNATDEQKAAAAEAADALLGAYATYQNAYNALSAADQAAYNNTDAAKDAATIKAAVEADTDNVDADAVDTVTAQATNIGSATLAAIYEAYYGKDETQDGATTHTAGYVDLTENQVAYAKATADADEDEDTSSTKIQTALDAIKSAYDKQADAIDHIAALEAAQAALTDTTVDNGYTQKEIAAAEKAVADALAQLSDEEKALVENSGFKNAEQALKDVEDATLTAEIEQQDDAADTCALDQDEQDETKYTLTIPVGESIKSVEDAVKYLKVTIGENTDAETKDSKVITVKGSTITVKADPETYRNDNGSAVYKYSTEYTITVANETITVSLDAVTAPENTAVKKNGSNTAYTLTLSDTSATYGSLEGLVTAEATGAGDGGEILTKDSKGTDDGVSYEYKVNGTKVADTYDLSNLKAGDKLTVTATYVVGTGDNAKTVSSNSLTITFTVAYGTVDGATSGAGAGGDGNT